MTIYFIFNTGDSVRPSNRASDTEADPQENMVKCYGNYPCKIAKDDGGHFACDEPFVTNNSTQYVAGMLKHSYAANVGFHATLLR